MAAVPHVDMRVPRLEHYALAARVAAVGVEGTLGRAVSRPVTCELVQCLLKTAGSQRRCGCGFVRRHACAPSGTVCVGRASCGRGCGEHVGPSGVAPLNVWATGTLIDASVAHRSLRAISMETLIGSTLVCRAHFELLFVVALGVSLVGLGCALPNV